MSLRERIVVLPVLLLVLLAAAPGLATSDEFRAGLVHDDLLVEISDDFGLFVGGREHRGIDLISPRGTAVLAVADGVVTTMEFSDRPGWYLAIEHADGWRSLYMHLNGKTPTRPGDRRYAWSAYASGLEVGDLVVRNQVIGYVGSSGNAEHHTPHTHFELQHLGEGVDPYPFVMSALVATRIELSIEHGDSPFR